MMGANVGATVMSRLRVLLTTEGLVGLKAAEVNAKVSVRNEIGAFAMSTKEVRAERDAAVARSEALASELEEARRAFVARVSELNLRVADTGKGTYQPDDYAAFSGGGRSASSPEWKRHSEKWAALRAEYGLFAGDHEYARVARAIDERSVVLAHALADRMAVEGDPPEVLAARAEVKSTGQKVWAARREHDAVAAMFRGCPRGPELEATEAAMEVAQEKLRTVYARFAAELDVYGVIHWAVPALETFVQPADSVVPLSLEKRRGFLSGRG